MLEPVQVVLAVLIAVVEVASMARRSLVARPGVVRRPTPSFEWYCWPGHRGWVAVVVGCVVAFVSRLVVPIDPFDLGALGIWQNDGVHSMFFAL